MTAAVTSSSARPELAFGPGADLSEQSLVGVDLSGRDLTGADLTDADLSRANLAGATFNNATMAGVILFEADLSGAQFIQADLTGADIRNARAKGAVFGGATLIDATFLGADLTECAFSRAQAKGADFRRATAVDARMHAIDLSNADLSNADLSNADLSNADLRGVDLTEATVDEASFRNANLQRSTMRALIGYTTTDWIGVDIVDSNFAGGYLVRRTIMDQNYLEEFRTRSALNAATYRLWKITSDCGRSLTRWGAWIIIMAVAFAGIYTFVNIDYGDYQTSLSPLYFSIVTLTTLGYGDGIPATQGAQIVVIAEVIMGYMMLGGLLSIFATKMGRRAE